MARTQQPQRGVSAAAATLETVAGDSERTLIIQRRGAAAAGNGSTTASWPNNPPPMAGSNMKRSAYFIDSASESSQAGSTPAKASHQRAVLHSPSRTVPQRALFGVTSRTTGRRCLDGIRDTNSGALQSTGQWTRGMLGSGGSGGSSNSRQGTQSEFNVGGEGKDGESLESKQKPAVFFGSIRFPASRVALWNRRATGQGVTVTPESAVPLLVLRQHAIDALVRKLSSPAAGQSLQDCPQQETLRWRGAIGSVVDILPHGRARDDPRAATAPSRTALEIMGLLEADGPERHTAVAAAAGVAKTVGHATGDSGRRRSDAAQGQQARMVAVQGVLVTDGAEGGEWRWWASRDKSSQGGGFVSSEDGSEEEYYRSLMDEYLKETKPPARSTSPDVYMPLRLQCSLRGSENDEIGGSVTGLGRGTAGAGGGRLVSSSGRGAAGGQQGEAFGLVASASEIRAKLSLRGEMIVPALGVRLTPIAPLALLHTALYQSLLTRGGEAKPQSGLLTLNEGRRAVLLSDTDPLSLRAPIVGVWVSGGGGGGADSITTRVQHARPPSPFQHPYTYPACLRFLMLLTARGGQQQQRSSVAAHRGTVAAAMGPLKAPRAKEDGSPPAAASAGAFLVLHLLGGVSGGTPSFFEGSATGPDGHGSRAGAASAGFEQLDFSADVDVVVKEEGMVVEGGRKRRGREMSGAGGSSSGSSGGGRTVVIGRLRRVSDPAFAQPFQRAQQQVSTSMRIGGVAQPLRSPSPPPPLLKATIPTTLPQLSTTFYKTGSSNTKWHVRHHATLPQAVANSEAVEPGEEEQYRDALDQPRQPPAPIAPPRKPTINTSPVSSPSQFSRRGEHSPIHAPLEVGDGKSSPSAYPLHRSPSPPMTRTPDEGLARPSPDLQDLPVNVAGTLPRRTPSPPAIHEQRPLDAELAPDENKPPVSGEQLQSSSSWTAPIRPFPPSLTSAAAPAAPSSWPKSDPVHLASGSGLTEKPDLDLCSLDPAARGFFLAQQQKLSNLESQLRLLRAEMMREPPAAALAVAVRAAERGPAQQQQAVGKAVAVECEATAMVAGRSMTMIGATVEASTNTSFVWGPPPRQSADDANHHSATVSTPAIDASVVPGASDHDRHNDERSSGTRSSGSGRPSTMRRKEVAVVTPEQQPPLRTVAANNPPRRQQQERVPSSSSARNSLPPPPQPGSRRRANSDISPDRQPATQGYSRGSSREKASNTASLAVSGWTTQRGRAATSVVNAKDGFTSSRSFSPPGGEQNQTPPVLLFNGGRSTSPEKKHDNRDHHDDNDAGRVVGGVGAGSGGGNVSSSEDGSFATMPSPVLLRVPVLGDDASALGGAGHGASEWVRVNAFQELAAAAAAPSSNARPSLPLGPAATVVEVTDSDDFTNAWPGTTQEGDEGKEPAVSSLASPAPSAVVEGGRGRQALPLIDRSNRETSAVQSADDSDEASSTAYQRPTQRRRRQRRRQGSRTRSRDDVGRELECHEGYSGILQVGLSVDSYPGGQGRLSGYYRRSLPMVAKAGGHQSVSVSAAAVLPGAMAGLLVVPRIEFGQLTDDELGSDLDEGETIVRIESKYLQGGS